MKKVFLSLATIAFVAAGSLTMTSCGGDDSTPGPTPDPVDPVLTENFIQVNDQQSELKNSIYAVHTTSNEDNAPIKVYKDTETGETFAGFYFISHDGASATTFGGNRSYLIYFTPYDTTKPEGEALILPFTQEGATQFGGAVTLMNDTQYNYASGASATIGQGTAYATESATGKLIYTIEGKDSDDATVSLKANVNTPFDGMYGMYVPDQGSKMSDVKELISQNPSILINAKVNKR